MKRISTHCILKNNIWTYTYSESTTKVKKEGIVISQEKL